MTDLFLRTTLVGATVTTGLTAGLLFAFAHSVMPGLATLDDHASLTAFQRIDAAIENPWFVVGYLGSPVLTAAALVADLLADRKALAWLATALALTVATLVITAIVHLPINAALQSAAPALADAADLRARFEALWVPWNVVRTATATASLTALCVALLASGRTAG